MSDVPMTTRQLNLAYDTIVKAGYVGLADQVLATITDLQAQNTGLRAEIERLNRRIDLLDMPANGPAWLDANGHAKW